MATNTTNYSFKKPDESDFYDVQDQNGNWDMADEALKSLDTPTFEDYTGSTPVPAANTAIDGIKSKTKLSALMSNIKAAFKGACLIGHIVNNCVTNNANLPLSAAQGKVLMDLYTRLNGEMESLLLYFGYGGYSESPIESFKRCFGQLPARRISIGHVANANYAAGFVCFKYNDTAGSAILFTYSDAYPNIMYVRLVSGAWVDS